MGSVLFDWAVKLLVEKNGLWLRQNTSEANKEKNNGQ